MEKRQALGKGLSALIPDLPDRTASPTEVDIDLSRDDNDALAPVLDEAWLGETGEWLTSRRGLRYRFHSYSRP